MAQRHRLGGLKMGEARHQVARVLFGAVQQGGLQAFQARWAQPLWTVRPSPLTVT